MNKDKAKFTAVIVAAGNGSRMKSELRKQFMEIEGVPVIAYTVKAFQDNDNIDAIVVVVPKGYVKEMMQLGIIYGFTKVKAIVEGGDKRFKSVYKGLCISPSDTDYVLIHDGVRPMVTQALIDRCCRYVVMTRACVAAVPVTDTIKRANAQGFAAETLDRTMLWSIQTPQAFSFPLLLDAYKSLNETIEKYGTDENRISDDAVIVENMTDCHVRIIDGDPRNIKITTPNDLMVAEAYLKAQAISDAERETADTVHTQDTPDTSGRTDTSDLSDTTGTRGANPENT